VTKSSFVLKQKLYYHTAFHMTIGQPSTTHASHIKTLRPLRVEGQQHEHVINILIILKNVFENVVALVHDSSNIFETTRMAVVSR